jgi:sigma-B regulation protein RsbU (phosphoserine phosphatase)
MFGEARVVELVRQEAESSAERILQRIVEAVTEFAAGAPQNDDMTLLIVKRL